MIKQIPDLPDNVLGFAYVGEVTGDDYKQDFEPVVNAAAVDGHKVRIVVTLGPDFDGFKAGAMVEDGRVGMGNWSAWERIALVTDKRSIVDTMHLFGWMVPGKLKVFPADSLTEAATWASEA